MKIFSALLFTQIILYFTALAQTSGGILFRLFESGGKQTECKFFFDTKQSVFVSKDGFKDVVYKLGDTTGKDYFLEQFNEQFTDSADTKVKYYTTQVYDEGNVIYKNLRDSILVFREGFRQSAIIVQEPKLPKILWQISDEKKMIDVYECQKATTFFRGRNYTAWFTRKIPISNGPWKLHGLPGLILEFQTDDNKYNMKFVRIVIPIEDISLLHKPIKGKRIDFTNYCAERKKRYEDGFKGFIEKYKGMKSITISAPVAVDMRKVEFQEINFEE